MLGGHCRNPSINCPNKVNQELGLRIVASKLYESVPLLERLRFRHRVFKLFQTRVKSRGVRWGLAAFTAALLIGAAFRATTPNSFAPEHANTAANPAPAEVLLQIGLPKITERLLPEFLWPDRTQARFAGAIVDAVKNCRRDDLGHNPTYAITRRT